MVRNGSDEYERDYWRISRQYLRTRDQRNPHETPRDCTISIRDKGHRKVQQLISSDGGMRRGSPLGGRRPFLLNKRARDLRTYQHSPGTRAGIIKGTGIIKTRALVVSNILGVQVLPASGVGAGVAPQEVHPSQPDLSAQTAKTPNAGSFFRLPSSSFRRPDSIALP